MMKTYSAKAGEIGRAWFVVDATDQVLGRLATRIATVIRGKHKPAFTPHLDVGDFVVVVNAEKVKLTGDKVDKKVMRRHSGYPGGLSEIPYSRVLETHPERVIEQAVWGMLPKGRLGRTLRGKLKVYAGAEHPHSSQKPEQLPLDGPIPLHLAPDPAPKPRKAKKSKDEKAEAKKSEAKKAKDVKPKAKKPKAAKPKAKKPKAEKPKAEKAEKAEQDAPSGRPLEKES
jgi:large subunit ribosomal protein L13